MVRIERLGERVRLSEALLGLVAALAADMPEITSAFAAMAERRGAVGVGVVVGSNLFNLAALLGLSAVVAGRIALHRRVVALTGTVGLWLAVVTVMAASGAVPPWAGLGLGGAALLAYATLLAMGQAGMGPLPLPARVRGWIEAAIREEAEELMDIIRPRRGGRGDVLVAAAALLGVVAASVTMERTGTALGEAWRVPQLVVGGVVLAAVTSLPNAVAAVYLASRRRGHAVLSTAMNSNALNIVVGFLVPATVIGLGRPSGQEGLLSTGYLALALLVLSATFLRRGAGRVTGAAVILAYLGLLAALVLGTRGG